MNMIAVSGKLTGFILDFSMQTLSRILSDIEFEIQSVVFGENIDVCESTSPIIRSIQIENIMHTTSLVLKKKKGTFQRRNLLFRRS